MPNVAEAFLFDVSIVYFCYHNSEQIHLPRGNTNIPNIPVCAVWLSTD